MANPTKEQQTLHDQKRKDGSETGEFRRVFYSDAGKYCQISLKSLAQGVQITV